MKKNTVIGLAVGLMLAASSGVSTASVVVYDNSSQTFLWKIGEWDDIGGDITPGNFLDIAQPPTQSGERRPGTFGKWYHPAYSSSTAPTRRLRGESGAETARTNGLVTIPWQDEHLTVEPTREYAPGEDVTFADNWHTESTYFYHAPFSTDLSKGSPAISRHAYLGVRVQQDDGWHYGWILFTDYQWPLMWAYETEPNVPIQVPIPAPSVGTFTFLTVAGLCARRRGGSLTSAVG